MTAAGWYYAQGDPVGSQRYWDGGQWVGEPNYEPAAPVPPPSMGLPQDSTYASYNAGYRPRMASPGSRMGARIIDVIIQMIFLAIMVSFDLGGARSELVVNNSDFQFELNGSALDTSFEYLLFALFVFVWTAAWTHLKGGTPGKLMVGMRVSNAATGAMPVDPKQAAIRAGNYLLPLFGVASVGLGGLASMIGFLIGLVSLIMLFADNQNRTVMDRIANTLVVEK